MTNQTGTPTKLRNGDWGARVVGKCLPGDVVKIRTKAGKEWDVEIMSVLWNGDCKWTGREISLCTTESMCGVHPMQRNYAKKLGQRESQEERESKIETWTQDRDQLTSEILEMRKDLETADRSKFSEIEIREYKREINKKQRVVMWHDDMVKIRQSI